MPQGRGAASQNWKGGRYTDPRGYVRLNLPAHPNADAQGHVYEHVFIVAQLRGRPVPAGAVVHHVNEDPSDNRPSNFVLCDSPSYHRLLHARMKARAACGNPSWRRCGYCGKWDDPKAMYHHPAGAYRHRSCYNEHCRARYLLKGRAA
jgi:hypothetical protein